MLSKRLNFALGVLKEERERESGREKGREREKGSIRRRKACGMLLDFEGLRKDEI